MSGEVTVQRGKVWTSGEKVTTAGLNQTGAPTARIDADSITSTELDLDEITPVIAEAVAGTNLYKNPALIPDLWRSLDDAIAVTVGGREQPAASWWVNPVGAATTVERSDLVPADAQIGTSMQINGAASVTTVDVGQFVPSFITATRPDYTLRVYLFNGTGSPFTPLIRIDAAAATDDESTVANAYSASGPECPNAEWTLIEHTIDASALTLTKGADFGLRIPSGSLNTTGKVVRLARWQLTPATTSAPWVHPAPPAIYDNLYAAAVPTVTDDQTVGYSVGSTWIYQTQVWTCTDATTGAAVWQELTAPITEEVLLAHTAVSGTNGGTATSGSWQVVPLNEILQDTAVLQDPTRDEVLAVSAGVWDLPTGYWDIESYTPRFDVDRFQTRLYNVTAGAVAQYADTSVDVLGTSAYASSAQDGHAVSLILGRIRCTALTKFRVECRVETTKATSGQGVAGSFGKEIYAIVRLKRLALA